jgi:hypothetical protein
MSSIVVWAKDDEEVVGIRFRTEQQQRIRTNVLDWWNYATWKMPPPPWTPQWRSATQAWTNPAVNVDSRHTSVDDRNHHM